jgi:hypothetical protein
MIADGASAMAGKNHAGPNFCASHRNNNPECRQPNPIRAGAGALSNALPDAQLNALCN